MKLNIFTYGLVLLAISSFVDVILSLLEIYFLKKNDVVIYRMIICLLIVFSLVLGLYLISRIEG